MYATQLNVRVVAQFVQSLIDAVLEAVPDASSRQPVPKAKVNCTKGLCLLQHSAIQGSICIQSFLHFAGGTTNFPVTITAISASSLAAAKPALACGGQEVQWSWAVAFVDMAYQSDCEVCLRQFARQC